MSFRPTHQIKLISLNVFFVTWRSLELKPFNLITFKINVLSSPQMWMPKSKNTFHSREKGEEEESFIQINLCQSIKLKKYHSCPCCLCCLRNGKKKEKRRKKNSKSVVINKSLPFLVDNVTFWHDFYPWMTVVFSFVGIEWNCLL